MRSYLIFLSIFVTAGCNATTRTISTSAPTWQTKMDAELAALSLAELKSKEECHGGKSEEEAFAEIDRNNVLKRVECYVAVSNKYHKPVAQYPELHSKLINTIQQDSRKFSSGKISKAVWHTRFKEAGEEYAKNYVSRTVSASLASYDNVSLCTEDTLKPKTVFEKEVKRRGLDCHAVLVLEHNRLARELARQEAAAARQQAASNSLNDFSNQLLIQQAIQNANRPVQTNCYTNPMGWQCTSQ